MNITRSTRRSKLKRLGELAKLNRKLMLAVISIISCLSLLVVSSIASSVDLALNIDNPISYVSDVAFDKDPNSGDDLVFYIRDYKDLQMLSNLVNSGEFIFGTNIMYKDAKYLVVNDIEFPEGETINPIGYTSEEGKYFSGVFDGGGYAISNLNISQAGDNVGLFGYTINAEIKNVVIESGKVFATGDNVGSIIGYASNTNLTNITNYADINSEGERVGGLVGCIINSNSESCAVTKSSNFGNVSATYYAGGLIGEINNISSTVSVTNPAHVLVENCFNAGNISGDKSGGLVGNVAATNRYARAFLTNAFSIGKVDGQNSYSTVYGNEEITQGVLELEIMCVFYLEGRGGESSVNTYSKTLEQMTGINYDQSHIFSLFYNPSVWEIVPNTTNGYNTPKLIESQSYASIYTITYDRNLDFDGNKTTGLEYVSNVIYTSNDTVILPSLTKYGFEFKGWKVNTTPENTYKVGGYCYQDGTNWVYQVLSQEEYRTYYYAGGEQGTGYIGNINLVAEWAEKEYTLTLVDLNGHTSEIKYKITTSDSIELPSIDDVGFDFLGWCVDLSDGVYSDVSSFGNGYEYLVNTNWIGNVLTGGDTSSFYYLGTLPEGMYGDVTLVAKNKINMYSVQFDENGGTSVSDIIDYTIESTIDIPTTTKAGCEFAGWKVTTAGGNWVKDSIYNADKSLEGMYGNVTLIAQWIVNQYTVNFDSNGGETIDPITYTIESTDTLPNITRNGYTFIGWKATSVEGNWELNQVYTTETTLEGKYGNVTLTAQWTANEYTVTFDPNGGTVSPTSITVKYDSKYGTLPTPTRDGYQFDGWYLKEDFSGTKITAATTVETATDHILYAKWTINKYNITFDENGGTEVSDINYTIIDAVTLPTSQRTAYRFVGWYLDVNGKELVVKGEYQYQKDTNWIYQVLSQEEYNTYYYSSGENGSGYYGNIKLIAAWEAIEYTITFNLDNETITSVTYTFEDKITFPTISEIGYMMSGWRVTEVEYDQDGETELGNWGYGTSYPSITSQYEKYGNVTLNAILIAEPYTVTLDTNGGNLDSGQTSWIPYTIKTSVSLPTPTRDGYTFIGWMVKENSGNWVKGTVYNSDVSAGKYENVTLVAQWNAIEYTIELVDGEETINSIAYTTESTDTLPSTTRTGFTFTGWKVTTAGGNWVKDSTYNADKSLEGMYGNVTLTAQWEANTYKVEFVIKQDGLINTPESIELNAIYVQYGEEYGYYAIDYDATKYNHNELPSPTKVGYTFDGWYLEKDFSGTKITETTTVETATGHILYAKWTATTYTITFNTKDGAEVNKITYTIEDKINLPSLQEEGYRFDGWSVIFTEFDEYGNPYCNWSIDQLYTAGEYTEKWGNVTLKAQWTVNKYTVTFVIPDGTVNPESKQVTYGEKYGVLPTPALRGYEFEGWYLNEDLTGAEITKDTTVTISKDHNLYAKWKAITYTLTVEIYGTKYDSETQTWFADSYFDSEQYNLTYDMLFELDLNSGLKSYYNISFGTMSDVCTEALWGEDKNDLSVLEAEISYLEIKTNAGERKLYLKNLTDVDGGEIILNAYYNLASVPEYFEVLNGVVYDGSTDKLTIPEINYLTDTNSRINVVSNVDGFDFYCANYGQLPTGRENPYVVSTLSLPNVIVLGQYGDSSFNVDYNYIVNPYIVSEEQEDIIVYGDQKEYTITLPVEVPIADIGTLKLSYLKYDGETGKYVNYDDEFASVINPPHLNETITISVKAEDVGKFMIVLSHDGNQLVVFGKVSLNLTINPKNIVIIADSDSKVYDGKVLVNNSYTIKDTNTEEVIYRYVDGMGTGNIIPGLTVSIIGSITLAGTTTNAVIYSLDDDVKDFYVVTKIDGTLTVEKRIVAIRPYYAELVYNGYSAEMMGYGNYEVVFGEIDIDNDGTIDLITTATLNSLFSNVMIVEYDGFDNADVGTHTTSIKFIETSINDLINDTDSYQFIYLCNELVITQNTVNPWIEWLENDGGSNLDYPTFGLGSLRFEDKGFYEYYDGIFVEADETFEIQIYQTIDGTEKLLFSFMVDKTTANQTITVEVDGRVYTLSVEHREIEVSYDPDSGENYGYEGPTDYMIVDLSEILKAYGSAEYRAVVIANPEDSHNLKSNSDETTPNLYTHTITLIKNDEGIDEVEFVGTGIQSTSKIVVNSTTENMLNGEALPISIITSRKITTRAISPTANSKQTVTIANTNKIADDGYVVTNGLQVGKTYRLSYTCTSVYGLIEIKVYNSDGVTLESTIDNGESFTLVENKIYKMNIYTNASYSSYTGTLEIEYIDISLNMQLEDGGFSTINKFNAYNFYTYLIQATYIYGTTTSEDVTIKATASTIAGEFGGFAFDKWSVISPIGTSLKYVGESQITNAQMSFYLPNCDLVMESISKESEKYHINYDLKGNIINEVEGTISGSSESYTTQYTEIDSIVLPENVNKPGATMIGWELIGVAVYDEGSGSTLPIGFTDWENGKGEVVYPIGTEFRMIEGADFVENWNMIESGMVGDVYFEAIYDYQKYTFITEGLDYKVSFLDEKGNVIPIYIVYDSMEWTNVVFYQVGGEILDCDTYSSAQSKVNGRDMIFEFVTYVDTINLIVRADSIVTNFNGFDAIWGNYENYIYETKVDCNYKKEYILKGVSENIYITGNTLGGTYYDEIVEEYYGYNLTVNLENPMKGTKYIDLYGNEMATPPSITENYYPGFKLNNMDNYKFAGWAYKTKSGQYVTIGNTIEYKSRIFQLDNIAYTITNTQTEMELETTLYAQWVPVVSTIKMDVSNENTVNNSGLTFIIAGKTFTWNVDQKIKIYNGSENNWRVEVITDGSQSKDVVIEFTYFYGFDGDGYDIIIQKNNTKRDYYIQYQFASELGSANNTISYTWDVSNSIESSISLFERFNITIEDGVGCDSSYIYWQYTTSINGTGAEHIGINGALFNSSVVLYAKVEHGYTFKGWILTKANGEISQITNYSYSVDGYYYIGFDGLNSDYEIVSVAESNNYTVTFDPTGGRIPEDTATPERWTVIDDGASAYKIVIYNSEYGTLPIPTWDGRQFDGWYLNKDYSGEKITNETIVTTARNHTLYAKWIGNKIQSVVFQNASNGDFEGLIKVTEDGTEVTEFYVGQTVKIVAIPNSSTQLTFAHWVKGTTPNVNRLNDYDSESNTELEYTFTADDEDGITFTACYRYIVRLYAVLNGSINNNAGGVQCETNAETGETTYNALHYETIYYIGDDSEEYTVSATAKANYTFVGWYKDLGSINLVTTEAEFNAFGQLNSGTITLYAKFIGSLYTVTFEYNGGKGEPANKLVNYNEQYGELPIPTRNGYTFDGWYLEKDFSGDEVTSISIVKATGDHTLYAKWITIEYIMTFASDGGTIIDKPSSSFTVEDEIVMPSCEKPGHIFSGWAVEILNDSYDDGNYIYRAGGNWICMEILADGETKQYLYIAGQMVTDQYGSVSLKAIYTESTNTIMFDENLDMDDNPLSNQSVEKMTFLTNSPIWIDYIPTKAGYNFIGWKVYVGATDSVDVEEENYAGVEYLNNTKWIVRTFRYEEDPETLALNKVYEDHLYKSKTQYLNVSYGNVTLVAQWEPAELVVNLDPNGGTVSPASKTVEYDSKYGTLPTPTRDGYQFDGWFLPENLSGVEITSNSYVTIAGNHELIAKWTAKTYTVTFISNGGANVGSINYTIESTDTLPSTTRTGFTFAGWKVTTAGGNWDIGSTHNAGESLKDMWGNVTLTAQWTPITYTITFGEEAKKYGAAADPNTYQINEEESQRIRLTIPQRLGYKFGGWIVTLDNNKIEDTSIINISVAGTTMAIKAGVVGNIELCCILTPIQYEITYQLSDGWTLSGEYTTTYTIEDKFTLPAPQKAGYYFRCWRALLNNGNWVTNYNPYHAGSELAEMYGDVTLIIDSSVIADAYTITYELDGGGIISSEAAYTTLFDRSDIIILPEAMKPGYTFTGWMVVETADETNWEIESTYTLSQTINDKYGNVTLRAQYQPNEYSITFCGKIKGYDSEPFMEKNSYTTNKDSETEISLTKPTRIGYTFAWSIKTNSIGVSTISGDTLTIPIGAYGNIEICGTWTPITYEITFVLDEGKLPSGTDNPMEYNIEDTIGLPLPTRLGYTFIGWKAISVEGNWELNQVYTTGTTLKGMYGNVTLEDQWEINEYTITIQDRKGDVITTEKYYVTSTLTIEEVTENGYEFKGLKVESTVGNWVAGTKYTDGMALTGMYGNVTLKVDSEAIEYIISFDPKGGDYVAPLKYTIEDTIDLPSTKENGYIFEGWKVKESVGGWVAGTEYTAGMALTGMYGNVTLEALLDTPITYTIEFNANGGTGTMDSLTVPFNTGQGIQNEFEKTGYTFSGWLISGNVCHLIGHGSDNSCSNEVSSDNEVLNENTGEFIGYLVSCGDGTYYFKNLSITNDGNVTFTAQWTPITYEITFDLDGGTLSDDVENPMTYTIESDDKLPYPNRYGYNFLGWEVTTASGNWSGNYNADKSLEGMYGNVTLTAKWEAKTYTVTLNFGFNIATTTPLEFEYEYDDEEKNTLNNISAWERNLLYDGEYYQFMWWSINNEGILVNPYATINNSKHINSANKEDSYLFNITEYLEAREMTGITLYAVYYELLQSYDGFYLIQNGYDLIELSRQNISEVTYVVTNDITMNSAFSYYSDENIAYEEELPTGTNYYVPKDFVNITLTSGTANIKDNKEIMEVTPSDGKTQHTITFGKGAYNGLDLGDDEEINSVSAGLFFDLEKSCISNLTFDFNGIEFNSNESSAGLVYCGSEVEIYNVDVKNLKLTITNQEGSETNQEGSETNFVIGGIIAYVDTSVSFNNVEINNLQVEIDSSSYYSCVGGMIGLIGLNSNTNANLINLTLDDVKIYIGGSTGTEGNIQESTYTSSGNVEVGGVIGCIANANGEIVNASVQSGEIIVYNRGFSISNVGGIVGATAENSNVEINGHSSSINLENRVETDDSSTGGIVGYVSGSTVINGDAYYTHNLFNMDEFGKHLAGFTARGETAIDNGSYEVFGSEIRLTSKNYDGGSDFALCTNSGSVNAYLIPVSAGQLYTLSWDRTSSPWDGYADPKVRYWSNSTSTTGEYVDYINTLGETSAKAHDDGTGNRSWFSFEVPDGVEYVSIEFNVWIINTSEWINNYNDNPMEFNNVRLAGGEENYLYATDDSYQNVKNATINGYKNVGGAVGKLTNLARVININTKDVKVKGSAYVGGIVGFSDSTYSSSTGEAVSEIINNSNMGYADLDVLTGDIAYCTVSGVNGSVNGLETSSSSYIGGIVGFMKDGNISACVVDDIKIYDAMQYVGGIAGETQNVGLIVWCATGENAKIELKQNDTTGFPMYNIGGFVGNISNSETQIANSTNNLEICVADENHNSIGGFVGRIYGGSIKISNSANYGSIWGENDSTPAKATNVGGIIGYVSGSGNLDINNVINAGRVSGNNYISAFIGRMSSNISVSLSNSIASGKIFSDNSNASCGDFIGNENSAEIKKENIYYDNFFAFNLSSDNIYLIGKPSDSLEQFVEILSGSENYQKGWVDKNDNTVTNYTISKLVGAKMSKYHTFSIDWLFDRDGDILLIKNKNDINNFRMAILNSIVAPNGTLYSTLSYKLMFSNDKDNQITSPLSTQSKPFEGIFDGNSQTLTIDISSNGNNVGLFGATNGATVKDLNVKGSVSGSGSVGLIIGLATGTTISNCLTISVSSVSGSSNVGGLVGQLIDGAIIGSKNNAGVSMNGNGNNIGGVVGVARNSTISSCKNYANGSVSGYSGVGGIAGAAISGTEVQSCENSATVSGTINVGGIAGWVDGMNDRVAINNSINSGQIKGSENIGGIAGGIINAQIKNDTQNSGNTQNSGEIDGKKYVGGIVGWAGSGVGISGNTSYIRNSGVVSGHSNVGGIAGFISSDVTVFHASNNGYVNCKGYSYEYCSPSSHQYSYIQTIDNRTYGIYLNGYHADIGGIVGHADGTINGVVNSGYVLISTEAIKEKRYTISNNKNYYTVNGILIGFGGIVGYLGGAVMNSEISGEIAVGVGGSFVDDNDIGVAGVGGFVGVQFSERGLTTDAQGNLIESNIARSKISVIGSFFLGGFVGYANEGLVLGSIETVFIYANNLVMWGASGVPSSTNAAVITTSMNYGIGPMSGSVQFTVYIGTKDYHFHNITSDYFHPGFMTG